MRRSPYPVVAVMHDDPDDQLLLQTAFQECRQDVRLNLFSSGEELLDYLNQIAKHGEQGSGPDLILMDLHLSGKDAFELLEDIKTNPDLKRIPLIVLTGSSSDSDITRSYQLGANTVITKPDLFDELVEVVRTLCDFWLGSTRM